MDLPSVLWFLSLLHLAPCSAPAIKPLLLPSHLLSLLMLSPLPRKAFSPLHPFIHLIDTHRVPVSLPAVSKAMRDTVPSSPYPSAIPCLFHSSLPFKAHLRHSLCQETLSDAHIPKSFLCIHMILWRYLFLCTPPVPSPVVCGALYYTWCGNAAVSLGYRNPCPHETTGRRQRAR